MSISPYRCPKFYPGRNCVEEEIMMEDDIPQSDLAASDNIMQHPQSISDQPSTLMLLRSSACDMDTDSQPSLEVRTFFIFKLCFISVGGLFWYGCALQFATFHLSMLIPILD